MRCYKTFDIGLQLTRRFSAPMCLTHDKIYAGVLGTLKLWVPVETDWPDKEYMVTIVGPGDPIDHIPLHAISTFVPWKWVFRDEPEDGREAVRYGLIIYVYEEKRAPGLGPIPDFVKA